MRLHPNEIASSMIASVTSRHNKAPVASASVNPICRPALSNPSCNGRGANRSRALTIFLIFTINRKFECKYTDKTGNTVTFRLFSLYLFQIILFYTIILTRMIRKATFKDIDIMVDIWLEASLLAHNFISPDYWKDNLDVMRNIYIPSSESYVHIDDRSKKIVGFISMNQEYLAAIFVSPPMQGKGIGKKLLNYVKAFTPSITLSVYSKNTPSISFYQHEGFQLVEERIDEDTLENEWVMKYDSSMHTSHPQPDRSERK